MKKKITAVALIVCLIALMIAAGTLSYLKDTETATNVFTIGDVDITLFEDYTPDKQDETQGWDLTDKDFVPTVTLEKDAWVKNTGSEDAFVRVFVLYPSDIAPMLDVKYSFDIDGNTDWADAKDENGNLITNLSYVIDGVNYTGRCLVYVKDGGVLSANESTSDTVTSVKLLAGVECAPNGEGTKYMYRTTDVNGETAFYTYTSATKDFPVIVVAQAGQAINAETTEWDANTALNTMFGSPATANPYSAAITSDFMKLVGEGDVVLNGDTVYSIGNNVTNLTVDGATVKSIGNYAGNYESGFGEKLETLIVTEGVESLGYRTFKLNPSLKTVVLPDSMTNLGDGAFQGCSALEFVTLPDTLTVLAQNTFRDCYLPEITLPETLTRIETNALRGTKLTSITIPENVTFIDNFAFRECPNLATVYILSENITFGGTMVFSHAQTGATDSITFYVKNDTVASVVRGAVQTSAVINVVVDPTIG